MKIRTVLLGVVALFISSCGFNHGYLSNVNHTQVILEKNNYTYVGSATGEASSVWIFGLGPLKNKSLVEAAKDDLVKKINLYDGSRALVNMIIERALIFLSYINFILLMT